MAWRAISLLALCALGLAQEPSHQEPAFPADAVRTYHSTAIQSPHLQHLIPPAHLLQDQPDRLFTFLGVRGETAWPAALLLDGEGELVWSGGRQNVLNVHKASYLGQDVLCYWTDTGTIGEWECLDQSYDIVLRLGPVLKGDLRNFRGGADPHELILTEQGTAILFFNVPTQVDLSFGGGPTDGWVFNVIIQEIDVETRELVWEWKTLDHFDASYTLHEVEDNGLSKEWPFDSTHLNSIEKDSLGNLLISLRGPSVIIYVDGVTGEILWRLGQGAHDFTMGDGTVWWFQHHARILETDEETGQPSVISLFENGSNDWVERAPTARGLIIRLDHQDMSVSLEQEFLPSFHHSTPSAGSLSILPDGNVLIGWGSAGYYSVYDRNGTLIEDTQLDPGAKHLRSYRTRRYTWLGLPTTPPDFAIELTSEGAAETVEAYASWNGATEVNEWRLLGGSTLSKLKTVSSTRKEAFETALEIGAFHEFLAVAAYDSAGQCLGVSAIHSLTAGRSFGFYGSCDAIWWADWSLSLHLAALTSLALLCVGVYPRLRRAKSKGYASLPPTPSRTRTRSKESDGDSYEGDTTLVE